MTVPITCPDCRSGNVEKRGYSESDESKQRVVCRACNRWFRVPLTYATEPTWERSAKELKELMDGDTLIITSAQNNTPLHTEFWAGLKHLRDHYDAKLLVIPVMYRNPTQVQELESTDAWWPKEVVPYLLQNDVKVCNGLRLLGRLKIQATAVDPLMGLESLSQGDSAVIAHAQVQMRVIATPQHTFPKELHTTGSASVKNYSGTKAGVKADFHHSLGAVIIEKDKGCFHLRGIVGDEKGEFYDINLRVTAKGVSKVARVEALVTGDTHTLFHNQKVGQATFEGEDSIVGFLRPKVIVRHDLIDSYSISHHHRGHPIVNFKKWVKGTNSLQDELTLTARFIEETTPKDTSNVVVASNHHDHIARWLEEADPKFEPWNSILYHELMLAWLTAVRDGVEYFDPFAYWMKKHCKVDCYFVERDEPYVIRDILISMHGDKGANGSRGSLRSLSKMGVKTIVGHTHTPAIEKGCYMVGTSSNLTLDYTSGPSSWLNTHCIIHENGKRQLINVINGRWRRSRE